MRLSLTLAIMCSVTLPLSSEAQVLERPNLTTAVAASDTVRGPVDPWSILLRPWLPEPAPVAVYTPKFEPSAVRVGKTVGLLAGIGLCLFDVVPPSVEYVSPSGRWMGLSVNTHEITQAIGGAIGLLLADLSAGGS
jgi:hypothetical protein